MKYRNLSGMLLLILSGAVAAVLLRTPFSWPMGDFWIDAQQFALSGHIVTPFTPCGYPALLGLGFRIGGIPAVIALQLLVYLGILAAVYATLRILDVHPNTALLCAGVLGLHPELLTNIKKIWDTNITVLFLMLICAVLLVILRRGLTPARALTAGILWGMSVSVRPNFPALVLPVVFAFWFAPTAGKRARTLLLHGALTLGAAVAALVAVNAGVHGTFYLSQNGPYNLYAGDNAFTEHALLANLNAEPSIYPSLVANGFSPEVDVYNPALRSYYVHRALLFIRQNPLQAVKLFFLKLGTLLRPDTKIHPPASLSGAVKVFVSLAVPFWLFILVASREYAWRLEDWFFLVCVVAYVLPFLLTNSDPRFRVPLDILVLTHAMDRMAKSLPLKFRENLQGGEVSIAYARAAR